LGQWRGDGEGSRAAAAARRSADADQDADAVAHGRRPDEDVAAPLADGRGELGLRVQAMRVGDHLCISDALATEEYCALIEIDRMSSDPTFDAFRLGGQARGGWSRSESMASP